MMSARFTTWFFPFTESDRFAPRNPHIMSDRRAKVDLNTLVCSAATMRRVTRSRCLPLKASEGKSVEHVLDALASISISRETHQVVAVGAHSSPAGMTILVAENGPVP